MNTSTDQPIIIVSGLPRSGTSMMMQMLVAGGVPILADDVRQADEDNPQGYHEFAPAKRTKDDASWLQEASGKAVKVIYALLADLSPNYTYRIIFMRRPMQEVLASQQAMLARSGEQGATANLQQLGQVFARELDRIEHWLEQQEHMAVQYVDYHAVLEDPAGQSQAIATFVGSDLDLPAMQACVRPSLYRQKAAPADSGASRRKKLIWGTLAAVVLLGGLLAFRAMNDQSSPAPNPNDSPTNDADDDQWDQDEMDNLDGMPYGGGTLRPDLPSKSP
jgi:hypothetical protein